jgi:hypothetical protein
MHGVSSSIHLTAESSSSDQTRSCAFLINDLTTLMSFLFSCTKSHKPSLRRRCLKTHQDPRRCRPVVRHRTVCRRHCISNHSHLCLDCCATSSDAPMPRDLILIARFDCEGVDSLLSLTARSHHITSHHITSYHIASHHITSHHIREQWSIHKASRCQGDALNISLITLFIT